MRFSDLMMTATHKCLPLERTFVLIVVSSGVLLLFMASTLIQETQYDLVRQYLAAKRAYNGRYAREMSETEDVINNLAKKSTSDTGFYSTAAVTQPSPKPATDPPWMANRTNVVRVHPFVPGKNQKHPFLKDYVIENADLCGGSRGDPVDILIVIHSSVKNFQRRRILRETWAGSDTLQGVSVRRVFLLGRDGSEKATQVLVNTEQASYGDVVQANFTDTFHNLTLKAVTGLRWINDHCPQARFILKSDDDVFVNVFSLVETFLQRLWGKTHAVMCHAKPENTSIIIRDPHSRWFVRKALLPGRTHWPAFCSGYLVVMTGDAVPGLYQASFSSPYIPVDDGFVYGVLPLLAGKRFLTYVDISQHLLLYEGRLAAQYRDPNQPLSYLAGYVSTDTALVKLWQAALNRLSPWAKQRASIVKLQDTMTPKVL